MANRHRLFVLKHNLSAEKLAAIAAAPWGGWTPVNPYGMPTVYYSPVDPSTGRIRRQPNVLEAVRVFTSADDAWMFVFGVHADGTDELSEAHRRAMRSAWKVVALAEVDHG